MKTKEHTANVWNKIKGGGSAGVQVFSLINVLVSILN